MAVHKVVVHTHKVVVGSPLAEAHSTHCHFGDTVAADRVAAGMVVADRAAGMAVGDMAVGDMAVVVG
jgi:hypothetical protein